MPDNMESAAARVRAAIGNASRGLVDREVLVELIALSAVAGQHLLVIGPPGTAKSEAVRRFARVLEGAYFEYLLGRFTEPSEIFGPVDFRRLKEGFVETDVTGMLPEAEIAFLDEVFQGSTAILNTLLGILNERVFRRGHTMVRCPLRVCVGASNALPADESLAAFADRFLLRAYVQPVSDARLEELLEGGWSLDTAPLTAQATMADLDLLVETTRNAKLTVARPLLAHAIRELRKHGVALSDRRAVKVQRVIAAAAALAGRSEPTAADLWPIVFVAPTAEQQALTREALRDLLAPSENASLPAAAEEASLGPAARATRIVRAGRELLDTRPEGSEGEEAIAWRLRLEGVAREIDAGFAPEQRSEDLAAVRDEIAAILEPVAASA
jgi:MoxR-like ATPase